MTECSLCGPGLPPVQHPAVKPEEEAAAAASLRQELENDRRGRFYSAYMVKARNRMKIEVNQDVLQAVTG